MSEDSDAALLRALEEAVAAMPRVQREIFLAHRVEGLPYEDIARRAGLSVREVERQMERAIAKLAKQMEGHPLSWWERWF
jgi:RNA polymerase sigma-70 factor (ECF subfamily)